MSTRVVRLTDRYGAQFRDPATLIWLDAELDYLDPEDAEHASVSLSDAEEWSLDFTVDSVTFENVEPGGEIVGRRDLADRDEAIAIAEEFLRGDFAALRARTWQGGRAAEPPLPRDDDRNDWRRWRQTSSPEVQDDLDAIVDVAFARARDLLTDANTFAPFAYVVTKDGSLVEVDADATTFDALIEVIRGMRDDIRAAGVMQDDRETGKALSLSEVHLEHVSGTKLRAVLPYRRPADGIAFIPRADGHVVRRIWTA